MGRLRADVGVNRTDTPDHKAYITTKQTLVYVCHAPYVLLTNTETELRENDEGSIYLLTDVMNIGV